VQIVYMDACKGPGNKVQDARALMEVGAFEGMGKGTVHAETGLGLDICPFELTLGAYSSI
jgi:hypothetical protein